MASGHYFHQDLLVARRIFNNIILQSMLILVQALMDLLLMLQHSECIQVFDIRALSSKIKNIEFLQADLMKPVDKEYNDYTDSLSCLHALEHFGLGRMGVL